ncbi:hypothetical protein L596_009879 [Steinernema carpocapsae]|uniref:Uncharacterized protein n=1 Tax=Steinernema carpocapsae TaxID=34508 RepID=A0A4U5PH49_STECR|nr:hypothetical protein L596_009879 [Steinernema carpocapsae]
MMTSEPVIHSARSQDAHNPFTLVRCCCRHVRTQDIVKPMVILSFVVFLATSIVLGLAVLTASFFPLVFGAIVYGLLFQAIFRMNNKTWVLAYVVYEAFCVGLLLVLVTTSIMVLMDSSKASSSNPKNEAEIKKDRKIVLDYAILFTVLIILKLYFTMVFYNFYKYLGFAQARMRQVQAQYVNGGVHINADQIFPPPPPVFTPSNLPADHPTRDPSYGYAIPHINSSLTQVPNYGDALSMRKEPPPASSMA